MYMTVSPNQIPIDVHALVHEVDAEEVQNQATDDVVREGSGDIEGQPISSMYLKGGLDKPLW